MAPILLISLIKTLPTPRLPFAYLINSSPEQPAVLTPRLKLFHPHLPPHFVAAASGYLPLPASLSIFPSPSKPRAWKAPLHLLFKTPSWPPISSTLPDLDVVSSFAPLEHHIMYLFWEGFFFFILNSRTQAQLWGIIFFFFTGFTGVSVNKIT